MAKQLLIDTMTLRLQVSEAAGGGKVIVRGQFGLADVPTANGRVYTRTLWMREFNRLARAIKERKVFGEADHPADGRTKLMRAAHIITSLTLQDDGQVIGEAEVMNTSAGKEIQAIVDAGGSIGVSSRGYGSVVRDSAGHDVVQDDFQLDTFDFVVDPAQGSAYPEFSVESTQKPEGTVKVEGKTKEDTAAPAPAAEPKKDDEAPKAEDADPKAGEDEPAPKTEAAQWGIRWKESKGMSSTTKEKFFATRAQRDKFADDLEKKDNFEGFDAWSNPPGEADESKTIPAALKAVVEQRIVAAVAEAKSLIRDQVRSELLSDPTVAASRAALESVKVILRPFILDGDVAVVLEGKETEIAALKAEIAKVVSLKTENSALSRAVKDLGFKLLLVKTLGAHPKFEEIEKSLGDLTVIENVDALQALLKPHMAGLKEIRTEEVAGSRKLIQTKDAEIARLSEAVKNTSVANKKVVGEREELRTKLHDATCRLYLERKIANHPRAITIRGKFESMTSRSKESIDSLCEAFMSVPTNPNSDFSRIRRAVTRSPSRRPSSTIVEDSVNPGGGAQDGGKTMTIAEGMDMDPDDILRLAGVKA